MLIGEGSGDSVQTIIGREFEIGGSRSVRDSGLKGAYLKERLIH